MAIIAILAALLMPALKGARESGYAVQCINNQKQVLIACLLYANENKDQLPSMYSSPTISAGGDDKYAWYTLLNPYYAGRAKAPIVTMLRCPAMQTRTGASVGFHLGDQDHGAFAPFTSGGGNPPAPPIECYSKRLWEITPNTILIADTNPEAGSTSTNNSRFFSPKSRPFNIDRDGDGLNDSNNGIVADWIYSGVAFRHKNLAVYGCADGSVRKMTVRQWVTDDQNMWGP